MTDLYSSFPHLLDVGSLLPVPYFPYISLISHKRTTDQRVTSDGLQYVVHTWSSDTIYLIQTNLPQNPVNNHCE